MKMFLHFEIPSDVPAKRKIKLYEEAISSIRRKLSNNDSDTLAIFDLLSISLRFEFERIINMVVSIIDWLDKHSREAAAPFGYALDQQDDDTGDLQAVKRINMALSHDALRHWCLPALRALVNRQAPLTAEEGRRLGFHRMAIVAEEREKRWRSTLSPHVVESIPPEFYLSD